MSMYVYLSVFVLALGGILLYSFFVEEGKLEAESSLTIVSALTSTTGGAYMPCSRYVRAREHIARVKGEIFDKWEIPTYPLFLSFLDVPPSSWLVQRNKLVRLLSQGNSTTKDYVVGFSGSSVTAGHDNYYRESFPVIFERHLAPVLASLDVQLIVRNQALGNNPCYPYSHCVETHMGADVDLLAWEQSMNCGRDPRPVESFIRSAVMLPRHPSLLFILSGTPYWAASECVNISSSSSKVPRTMSKEEQELLLAVAPAKTKTKSKTNNDSSPSSSILTSSTTSMQAATSSKLSKHLQGMSFLQVKKSSGGAQAVVNTTRDPNAGTSSTPVSGAVSFVDVYGQAAMMGQNILALDKYKCLGPYNANFSTKTLGGGASWHPGKLGHELRGDNLAFLLLSLLEDALDVIDEHTHANELCHYEQVPERGTRQRQERALVEDGETRIPMHTSFITSSAFLTDFYSKRSALPSPLACAKEVCGGASSSSSSSSSSSDTHPFVVSTTLAGTSLSSSSSSSSSPQCFTDYEPRVSNNLSSKVVGLGATNWTHDLSFFDKNAVLKGEAKGLGYRDRKYIYSSNGQAHSLSFLFTTTTKAPVWICETQKGFLKYPATMGDLDKAANVNLLANVKRYGNIDVDEDTTPEAFAHIDFDDSSSGGGGGKGPLLAPLVPAADQCYKTAEAVGPGTHILSLSQKGAQAINVAYLVYW